MKSGCSIVLCLAFSGCANQLVLSPEGSEVRLVNATIANSGKCKHVGMVQANQRITSGGMRAAEVEIRNRAAAIGGNALIVSTHNTSDWTGYSEIVGDAYRCNF